MDREKPSPPVKNDHADELANRLASMPAAEAIRGPKDWAAIMSSLRAQPQPSAASEPVAWRVKNDYGHWYITQDESLANTYRDIEKVDVQPLYLAELTATCTKLLPGGIIDDSTYSQIEDALDAIDAPMTGDGGRYLTISERIAALNHSKSDALKSAAEKALNYIENTESELGMKLSCGDALREALK